MNTCKRVEQSNHTSVWNDMIRIHKVQMMNDIQCLTRERIPQLGGAQMDGGPQYMLSELIRYSSIPFGCRVVNDPDSSEKS